MPHHCQQTGTKQWEKFSAGRILRLQIMGSDSRALSTRIAADPGIYFAQTMMPKRILNG